LIFIKNSVVKVITALRTVLL